MIHNHKVAQQKLFILHSLSWPFGLLTPQWQRNYFSSVSNGGKMWWTIKEGKLFIFRPNFCSHDMGITVELWIAHYST